MERKAVLGVTVILAGAVALLCSGQPLGAGQRDQAPGGRQAAAGGRAGQAAMHRVAGVRDGVSVFPRVKGAGKATVTIGSTRGGVDRKDVQVGGA